MPVFSLPSKYGIGCFSKEAYKFVDKLKKAGQSYWQILPLGPTGYGDSPYQSFSTFAGNPYYIDLKTLIKEGLLTKKECKAYDFGENDKEIDYEKIYRSRFKVQKKAYDRFEKNEEFTSFVNENDYWLEDYALYMAIKDRNNGVSWKEWEAPLRDRDEAALAQAREELAEEIDFYRFQQYEFDRQWKKLHAYALLRNSFSSMRTTTRPEWQGVRRMRSLLRDSCGATHSITGNTTRRLDMHGGSSALPTA